MKPKVDTYSAIIPLLLIFKVSGLLPLVLKGEIGKRRLQVSVIFVIYSFCIAIFTIIVRLLGLVFLLTFGVSNTVLQMVLNLKSMCCYFISTQLLLLCVSTSSILATRLFSILYCNFYSCC